MMGFSYASADSPAQAVRLQTARAGAKYLGGGTNLVDLMREAVKRPEALVDVSGLPRRIAAHRGAG